MTAPLIMLHLRWGWALMLVGVFSGAVLGLGFHRPDFIGGYQSFRRRILRLGHIACFGLGILNLLFAATVWIAGISPEISSPCMLAALVGMPLVCFLTVWQEQFRYMFVVPVGSLAAAVVEVLLLLSRSEAVRKAAPALLP